MFLKYSIQHVAIHRVYLA